MKSTENFKKVIEQHLQHAAQHNPIFAEKLKNPKKNIDDCITYILNQVKKSGKIGFEDTEVFGLAMHYYDEENIEIGGKLQAQIVVNQEVKLTEEEIKEAKEKARNELIAEEKARMRKKPAKATPKPETKEEPGTLF